MWRHFCRIHERCIRYQLPNYVTRCYWIDNQWEMERKINNSSDWGEAIIYKKTPATDYQKKYGIGYPKRMWNTVKAEDLDNDGTMSYSGEIREVIALYYVPQNPIPWNCGAMNFDNKEPLEQINPLAILKESDYPIPSKKELTTQMVALKSRNLSPPKYAKENYWRTFCKRHL